MKRLSRFDIKQLVDATLSAGIDSPRSLLLKGLPLDLDLQRCSKRRAQVELDLEALNRPFSDVEGDPLMIWLENAAALAFPRAPEYELFTAYQYKLRTSLSPVDAQIRRAHELAEAMRAFRETGGGVIRVSAGFSALAIPKKNAHPNRAVADALQEEREAMADLLHAGTFTVRALLHPGPWARDPEPTPERIDRRARWLAYMKGLRTILRAQTGSPKATGEQRRAYAGWKLDVVFWSDRPHHNLLLLGEQDRFAGSRLKRGGGYTRTTRVRDRAFVKAEAETFDLLFAHALAHAASGTRATTPAAALIEARRDLLHRLERDVKKMKKWLARVPEGQVPKGEKQA